MATSMVTYEAYEELALADPDGFWELHHGEPRRKPDELMTTEHNRVAMQLARQLLLQLDESRYEVRVNNARARRRSQTAYIPDVLVIPVALVRRNIADRRFRLETYEEPLPLVVEVWSPSTGSYDVNTKLPEYQQRGDQEIWRIQPYERTVTAWRRRPDSGYDETVHTAGAIEPVSLPGVVINVEALFDL